MYAYTRSIHGGGIICIAICLPRYLPGEGPIRRSAFQGIQTHFCKLVQIVLLFRPGWEEGERHFHVSTTIEGGSQVKILDVQAHEICAFGAEDAVPHQF